MLFGLSSNFGAYLYEVFVARADVILALGLGGQLLFSVRFLVQWLASERAGRTVVPVAFWYVSLAGGLVTLVYGLIRRDAVIILGQAPSIFIYSRNLALVFRERRRRGTVLSAGEEAAPPA